MARERAEADLRRLTQEADVLRTKLADMDAKIEKLKIYLEMARLYEGTSYAPPAIMMRTSPPTGGRPSGVGVTAQAVEISKAAIRERGKPIHTRELLEILAEQNVVIGGANPVANLSGFLSRSHDLKNSRKYGWGLAEWQTEDEAPSSQPKDAPPHSAPDPFARPSGRANLDDEVMESTDGTPENNAQEYIE